MKKKNGFTLIELLITIALSLTILAIAIVSFITINESKKEEALELVHNEAIAAAKEYFAANEYLTKSMDSGSLVFVSIGKLVSEDYLNKLVDPTTGNAVDKCDFVYLTKGTYKYGTKDLLEDEGINTSDGCIMAFGSYKKSEFNGKTTTTDDSKKTTTTDDSKETTTNNDSCPKYTYSKEDRSKWYNENIKVTYKDENGEHTSYISENGKNKSIEPVKGCKTAGYNIDKETPTCKITLKGSMLNKVDDLQWYKSDVKISLSGSSISGIEQYSLTPRAGSGWNGKKTETQKGETNRVTWYGYVMNNAGTQTKCKKTFAIERNVTLSFNYDKTNNSRATAPGAKGGKVFPDNKKGILKYQPRDGSGNCLRWKASEGKYVGCGIDTDSHKYYFAKACMNVTDYIRYFNVSSMSGVKGEAVYSDKETTTGLNLDGSSYTHKHSPVNDFNKLYYAGKLNDKGSRTNLSKKTFYYKSPAGNVSNKVTLYTEYSVNCGY